MLGASEGASRSSVVCRPPALKPFWYDQSFQTLLARQPKLQGLTAYFPTHDTQPIFSGQEHLDQLWSSYKEYGYGYLFYALARFLQPVRCVELGVLQGFSLLAVASALRDNEMGQVQGFDLFEAYPYHHEQFTNVLHRIKEFGLGRWASVEQRDAFNVHAGCDTIDMLHVDISNTGDTYRTIFRQWATKVTTLMLFEGGSVERDQVEWMLKYQKPAIATALEDIRNQFPSWEIMVLEPYPSVTVALRRS